MSDKQLEAEVVSAVAIGNLKAISEQPGMLSNLAYSNTVSSNNLGQQNSLANQQAVNEIGISIVAKASNTISNLNPLEVRSAIDVLTDNALADDIASLKATLQAFSDGKGGGAGQSGNSGSAWREFIALIKSGLRVNKQGYLVVPAGVTVMFRGDYQRENIKVTLENDGVIINVIPTP